MGWIDYSNLTFSQVWDDEDKFYTDYSFWMPKLAGSSYDPLTEERARQNFYLLYAKYGNSPIANSDVNQFKVKLFSTIFQYGGAWSKKQDIQQALHAMDIEDPDDDMFKGTKSIYNHAYNPSTEPGSGDPDELSYINEQNVSQYKYNKMDAYRRVWELMKTDVTEEYLRKFSKLFSRFAGNRHPAIYETED